MTGPLDGMLVIDMTEVMQGPLAAQILGDYGADVIKIERGGGDLMRGLDRDAIAAGEMSAYFTAVNRNKRSIQLDLKHPEGQEILHRLLERADVLVHSYRPDAVRRLNVAYDDLAERYPRLVYASASGWGETGPLTHKAGQDILAQSFSGMARAVADPAALAEFNPVATTDFASGMSLAQGVLAALIERGRTGHGQHVSVNLLDTAIAQQMLEAASLMMYGRELNWVQQWWSGIFETTDGFVTVLGFFRENAIGLACKALDLPDLSQHEDFDTTAKQAANRDRAHEYLAPHVKGLTTAAAVELFDSVDLLCAPLLTLEQALTEQQVILNNRTVTVEVPGQGELDIIGHPVHMSGSAPQRRHTVPLPGQHSDEILSELGFGEQDVASLRQGRVVR
ncbi:CoA transferase [Rhodococcus sp. 14C212]|uniref:CaiB/BaiF CoA transferase family protein n=1 Tax=Rhodococcus sp. 14C212 TaxID=2711209 RepID=UPI0013EA3B82|nr:CaiB/BaiF CoA-transferase family protein [Rhodococcus sp. 14C212]NGP05764.1 CoA transferase [Rhodococcus sp. 14C212]